MIITIESSPGTYLLILNSKHEAQICAGALGELAVLPGTYIYVGSALGPGGLRTRINRHMKGKKKCRWHIDYLRAKVRLAEAWYAVGKKRRECTWSNALKQLGGTRPFPGFGSSDCRCRSHLFYFKRPPKGSSFSNRAGIQISKAIIER